MADLCAGGTAGLLAALAASATVRPCHGRRRIVRRRASIWRMLDLPVGASKDDLRKSFKEFVRREHPDVKGDAADRSKFDLVMAEYKKIMDVGEDVFFLEASQAFAEEKNLRYTGRRDSANLNGDDTGFVYRPPPRKPPPGPGGLAEVGTAATLLGGAFAVCYGLYVFASTPAQVAQPEPEYACDETGCEEQGSDRGFNFYEDPNDEELRLKKKFASYR